MRWTWIPVEVEVVLLDDVQIELIALGNISSRSSLVVFVVLLLQAYVLLLLLLFFVCVVIVAVDVLARYSIYYSLSQQEHFSDNALKGFSQCCSSDIRSGQPAFPSVWLISSASAEQRYPAIVKKQFQ